MHKGYSDGKVAKKERGEEREGRRDGCGQHIVMTDTFDPACIEYIERDNVGRQEREE